jgi:Relaxase/Mobilisation nuclease domain
MIGKTAKFGARFLGAIEYCYYAVQPNRSLNRTQVRGELLYYQHVAPGLLADPNMANASSGERLHIEAIARQFVEVARRNSRVEKPVWHQVFSFPIEEAGEGNTAAPTRSTMVRIAQEFAQMFGLANNPMVVFRHSEKDHDHFHIIASRVNLDGVNSAQSVHNFRRIGQFCRDMETKYNLTPTLPMLSLQPAMTDVEQLQNLNSTTSRNERIYPRQRSTTADKAALRQAIDQAVLASDSLTDFCQRLADDSPYEVLFVPYTAKDGQEKQGIAYGLRLDSTMRSTPGYSLGRDYVYGGITGRIRANGDNKLLASASNLIPPADKNTLETGVNSVVSAIGALIPTVPFAGTAARHESEIERDIARITRSLNQTTLQYQPGPHRRTGGTAGNSATKSTKGVLLKSAQRKTKRRKGL